MRTNCKDGEEAGKAEEAAVKRICGAQARLERAKSAKVEYVQIDHLKTRSERRPKRRRRRVIRAKGRGGYKDSPRRPEMGSGFTRANLCTQRG